ncbi:MAG: phosphoenolpyruvate--protein phosphotransferase [Oscillospiraceae bacterium]|jgi:phosphotransferase system enzyme I (PtsI)|nr:phosphoenolpyruvate--protein phosphotransferase [Oscillospiraceae bacterium]
MLLKGIGASPGAALAPIHYIRQPDLSVKKLEGKGAAAERARFERARERAFRELDALYETAAQADPAAAQIFEIHKLMLGDPDFCDGVEAGLSEGLNAEYAVSSAAAVLADFLNTLDNAVMRGRAADIRDAAGRIILILKGAADGGAFPEGEIIVAAEDLLPSQTVRLDRNRVRGFVTKYGAMTSHSVILARTMGIPCVVGLGEGFDRLPKSGELAVDGRSGELLFDMSGAERAAFLRRAESAAGEKAALSAYTSANAVTPGGHSVLVCANIGGVGDAEGAAAFGADGVGLFRSEFLYLESPGFPDEETQLAAYRAVLEKLAPKPVTIRTLDLGSDKQLPYFDIPGEENPALGCRAIRICLKEPSVFRTQLRALLRASVYGKLEILFPMITSLDQVLAAKERVSAAKAELGAEGLAYSGDILFGVMIETPAAALMSDILAREVDFFSIGTNDLTQYTLAADRTNARVRDIFNPADPAVLKLIKMTAENAHANGIRVGICGESAADTSLTGFYMSIGIDELSVSPAAVPAVKKAVIESSV